MDRERYSELGAALRAIEQHGLELERTADTRTRGGTLIRKIEPVPGRDEEPAPLTLAGGAMIVAGGVIVLRQPSTAEAEVISHVSG